MGAVDYSRDIDQQRLAAYVFLSIPGLDAVDLGRGPSSPVPGLVFYLCLRPFLELS